MPPWNITRHLAYCVRERNALSLIALGFRKRGTLNKFVKKFPLRCKALVILLGLAVRLMTACYIDFSFSNDVLTFQIWAIMLWEDGFRGFFHGDFFSDYPPVYLYVLYVVGMIRSLFELPLLDPLLNLITFAPAMIFDVLICVVLAKEAARRFGEGLFPVAAASLWLFNPAVILVSSIWGQVESVYALILLLSLGQLRIGRLMPSYILFGVAVLTKPQSLFLGPVYLYSAYVEMRCRTRLRYLLMSIAVGMAAMVLVSLPFSLAATASQLVAGIGLYDYASVNAFNFWALFGQNWAPVDDAFLGIGMGIWGVLIGFVIVAASLFALDMNSKLEKLSFYFIAAMIFVLVFVFFVRMHERYLYPALVFFLAQYVGSRDKITLALYGAFSVTFFVNCLLVLMWSRGQFDVTHQGFALMSVSAINVVLAALGVMKLWFGNEKS